MHGFSGKTGGTLESQYCCKEKQTCYRLSVGIGGRNVKSAVVLFGVICLVVISGCSGGGSSIITVPPVSAQTGYSNASITGTYSLVLEHGSQGTGTGFFVADGNGNITSGTMSIVPGPCNASISGTYNLSSTASGTAAITATQITGPTGCLGNFFQAVSGAWPFNIQAGASGASLLFGTSTLPAGVSGSVFVSGSAVKQ